MDRFNKLEKSINNDFHGVISIKEEDKIIYEKAVGFADWANERPINMETKFGTASGTKFFTALAIMTLIDEGKLQLDSKAFDYVDYEYPTYDSEVTIAELLSHTSGIPDYFDEDEVEDFDNFTVGKPWQEFFDPKDYFEVMPQKPMVYERGTDFAYNNSGFVFLASIVAKVSGMRYVDYVTEKIFKTIGMTSSGFFPLNNLPANTANGYIEEEKGYRTNIYNLPIVGGGDGGAFTTVSDMYCLWNAFFEGKIISKELVEIMTKPVSVESLENADTFYGLGMWIKGGFTDEVSGKSKIVAKRQVNVTQTYIEGCDAGVSFRSGVVADKKVTYTIISNTTEGIWDILDDIKEIIED